MDIEVLSPARLGDHQLRAWSRIREADPMLANPFFDVGFARAVAEVCGRVEIAVLVEDGEIVGLFPFQSEGGAGLPLGTRVSEIQGAITQPATRWDPLEVMDVAGLKSWAFDCVPSWQRPLAAYEFCSDRFPYASLEGGFDAYRLERSEAGSRQIQQASRKGRRLARERGELRFELHTEDAAAMQALQRWKSAQYARTGTFDLFRLGWVSELLKHVRDTQSLGFSGVMSALYAADEIVAIHMGMRSGNVLAWWFPAYNREYERYSPGLILLAKILEAAPDAGIQRVDFGRGGERYKSSFASGSWQIGEGLVDARLTKRMLGRGLFQLRSVATSARWAELPLRHYRQLKQSRAVRRGE